MISLLCDALEVPLLLDDPGAPVRLNAAAAARLGVSEATSLAEALAAGGLSRADVAGISAALGRARMGEESLLVLATGERAVVFRWGPSGCGVVLARPAIKPGHEIAADISHEIANALAAITGWARLARQGSDASEALVLIENSATSAWAAARRILGKEPHSRAESLDLSAFVEEVARLLSWKARECGVEVRVSAEPAIRVIGDRGHAWSIVWNLAINALDALTDGGQLALWVSRVGGRAVLDVVDDGPGMTSAVLERAFERRFTTKASGSGLGLALVKETAEALGGSVEIDSEPGRGTRVRVELPCPSLGRAEGRRASGVYYAGPLRGHALVVDDDDGVREMIATALRTRGAEVTAVASAGEALAQAGPFDLAVLDLQLEGTHGDELLAELRRKGVVKHGMLVSGAEPPRHPTPGGAPDAVLRKPFELDDLFGLVPDQMRVEGEGRDDATRTL